nr:MAG TPA: hypothetical protein [Caudoviricetes sp.]
MDTAENQSLESLKGALVALRYMQGVLLDEAKNISDKVKVDRKDTKGDLADSMEQLILLKIAGNNTAIAESLGVQIDRVLNTITKTQEIRESVKNNPLPKESN